ncbi:ESCRT-III subunit protein VPS20 Ecym_7340 [Eremothecium cymbalariae DBVPG|uniref:Vacuolar protein sorting-associated protein 20 n=1 Tax=Eremothecium cymbalariae (strain CBS 270.75 / DBVPG 7215 / KCTC 17166 / NRRL Y-17582) TaxID=931890 RepID=G8JWF5_ERECY|nr:hypothetical protein Ecym_7340 [Eremothecium cymbalariae DBVPG\
MGQKGSKIQVTATDKAILQLKLAKDNLHRYSKRTDTLIEQERKELRNIAIAEKEKFKKNARARLLLKRIHYQQHLLDQCSDQLINLENMLMTIEFKLVEKQFIEGLTHGNEVLKKLNREFSGVEELMDDFAEQVAYQEEIDEVLGNSTVSFVGNFQQEIDKELDILDAEINAKQTDVEAFPSTEGLPEVRHNEPAKNLTEESAEEDKALLHSKALKKPMPA